MSEVVKASSPVLFNRLEFVLRAILFCNVLCCAFYMLRMVSMVSLFSVMDVLTCFEQCTWLSFS